MNTSTPVLPQLGKVLRTPESCFSSLHDFPYSPHYVTIGQGAASLQVAYIDEGPSDAPPILLMHGEPTWSYLYRKMIPVLVAAGYRVIAPDLIGFGRSDKPASKIDYSYFNHVQWMTAWLHALDLTGLTLFCQDWGSLIGLRLAAENETRFDRIVLGNGGLPTGNTPLPLAFKVWRAFAAYSPWFPIGRIVRAGCAAGLSPKAVAAYDAPFPSSKYQVAARLFPQFVPADPTDPERERNEKAWDVYKRWNKPFLTLFSTRDPITRGGEKMWQQLVPGAMGQAHQPIHGAGHFLQEDKGAEIAESIVAFILKKAVTQPI